MMTLPHLLAGAAIGRRVRPVWLAAPAALASHFVFDHIPHAEPPGDLPYGLRWDICVFEGLVAAVILVFATRGLRRGWMVVMLCAFLSVWPDLMRGIPFVSSTLVQLPVWRQLLEFHDMLHSQAHAFNCLAGIWPQLAVSAASLWALRGRQQAVPEPLAV